MTIPVQVPFNQYVASGITDTFAFTFRILANEDLIVSIEGVVKIENVDYTIQDLTDLGGNVVFGVAPDSGDLISLIRETPVDQDVVYTPFDAFPAKTHEGALDKLTMIFQERRATDDQGVGLPLDPSGFFWDAKNLLIRETLDPLAPQDVATKQYVDTSFGGEPFDPADDQIITGSWQFTQIIQGTTDGNPQEDVDEIITGGWTFTAVVEHTAVLVLANNVNYQIRDFGGTGRNMVRVNTANLGHFGNSALNSRVEGANSIDMRVDALTVGDFVSRANGSLQLSDPTGTLHTVAKTSFDEQISGQWVFGSNPFFSTGLTLTNTRSAFGLNPSAVPLNLAKANSTFQVEIGDVAADLELVTAGGLFLNGAPLNDDDGLIQLTAAGKVPVGLLPFTVLEFQGTFDASSGNNPPDGVENGEFFVINVAGTLTIFVADDGTPVATAVAPGDYLLWINFPQVQVSGYYFIQRETPVFIDSDNVTYNPAASRWTQTSVQDVLDEISDRAALRDFNEIIVNQWRFNASITFENQFGLIMEESGGTGRVVAFINLNDEFRLGSFSNDAFFQYANNITYQDNLNFTARFIKRADGSFEVADTGGVFSPVARTGGAQNILTTSYRWNSGSIILTNNLNISGIPEDGVGTVRVLRLNPSNVWEVGQASSVVAGMELFSGAANTEFVFKVSTTEVARITNTGFKLPNAGAYRGVDGGGTERFMLRFRTNELTMGSTANPTAIDGDVTIRMQIAGSGIMGEWTSGGLALTNLIALRGKETGGTARNMVNMTSSNNVEFGNDTNRSVHRSFEQEQHVVGGVTAGFFLGINSGGITVISRRSVSHKVGFRSPETISNPSTIIQDYEGLIISQTGSSQRTWTINTMELGTNMIIINQSTLAQTLVPGSASLSWVDPAGAGNVNSLTIAANSVCQLHWRAASSCTVWGSGISL